LNQILAFHTGQPADKVADDVDRDYFMGPEEASEYGVIDRVLARRDTVEKPKDSDAAEAKE
jgi:ATP-dependent Clp protease protease subunit